MIKVRLNGAVTSVDCVEHNLADHVTHMVVATTLEPVLPSGDWVEVTRIDSDMREFASAELVWAGEEQESGYLS